MTREDALKKMVPPSQQRPGKPHGGVIQIWTTRACDKSCYGCTQASNIRGNPGMISVTQFEEACISLKNYFGIVGVFGGNPAMHPQFPELCEILRKYIPFERRGLWSNNPLGHGHVMRDTFNPAVSNLNVHLDQVAYDEFLRDWPQCNPFGLNKDSRHSQVWTAMKDIGPDLIPNHDGTWLANTEENRWELIAHCDINQHWSAMIGVFRGELRAWFCEIAGAQAMLKQHDPNYPDTGFDPAFVRQYHGMEWWQLGMDDPQMGGQADWHCHRCGVPMNGYGELAQAANGQEFVTLEYEDVYLPKKREREVIHVTDAAQIKPRTLTKMTDYMGNGAL